MQSNFIKKCLKGNRMAEDKPLEYVDLAPNDTIDNGAEYLKALGWALENERIRNIALAGPYGAGKSSILETFLKKHPEIDKKSLRISMATFIKNENNREENPQDEKRIELKADEIEEGILKQLFYKVNYKKVPQSRYRRLHRVSILQSFSVLVVISCILLVGCFVFFPDALHRLFSSITIAGDKLKLSSGLSCSIMILLWLVVLYGTALVHRSVLSRLHVNKISLESKVGKMDAGSATENVFNKYLDEIVYFFEETKYQYIFFEDLDRLNHSSIFVHLRELNNVLNNYDAIHRRIIFVYALKDDIFSQADRTKFFDFIIPVIPVINSTNSGEILLSKVNKSRELGKNYSLSQDFILDVSPYISDMRVLQNIYNEFIAYKEILQVDQELHLNDEPMMSLIIFKNLYPHDFADLQAECGVVKKAFEDKQDFIEKQCAILFSNIEDIKHKIETYDQDCLKNVNELKYAMLGALAKWKGLVTELEGVKYGDIQVSLSELMKPDYDLSQLKKLDECDVTYISPDSYYGENMRIGNWKEIIDCYYDRWLVLREVQNVGKEALQEKLESNKLKSREIFGWSLKKLLLEYSAEDVLSESVRQNKLLVFMFRKGYIDEKYTNYINYFKATSITKDDMNYILSVKNRELLPATYSLTKTHMVIQRLQPYEFAQKELLNFDILEQLLTENEDSDKLNRLIEQLADESDACWNFIDSFMDRGKDKPKFLRLLVKKWPNMWNYIVKNSEMTYARKANYLHDLIQYIDFADFNQLDRQSSIKHFIEGHEDILYELRDIASSKMISVIAQIPVSFKKVSIEGVSPDIIDYIFNNNRYAINADMIQCIVKYKKPALVEKLAFQNYTVVCELGYQPLLDYIDAKITEYISAIVLSSENVCESKACVIELIEKAISDVEVCQKTLLHENVVFERLTECGGKLLESNTDAVHVLWDTLLENDKVVVSWENMYSYWEFFRLTDNLIQYMENHASYLATMHPISHNGDFTKDLIKKETIGNEALHLLLSVLPLNPFNLDFACITKERMAMLVELHYFEFNESYFTKLGQQYPELREKFIVLNQDSYMRTMETITIDRDLFISLMHNPQLDNQVAQVIFARYASAFMVDEIALCGIQRHLNFTREQFSKAWNLLSISDKQKLMINCLPLLDGDDFYRCFNILDSFYPEFKDRSRRHNIEIDDNLENMKLADRLKEVGYISSYRQVMRNQDEGLKEKKLCCVIRATK